MLIRQLQKKLVLLECTNEEKMDIRRTCVNVATAGSTLLLEDNLFNRVYLQYKVEELLQLSRGECAPSLNPLLRDYQIKDVLQMLPLNQVFNRNKPGYGKTFEAVEYCRLKGLQDILVVCPKSVAPQWTEQFLKWWPEVNLEKLLVTNYEQLTPRNVAPKGSRKKILHPSQLWLKCKCKVWDIIILDESHRIKSNSAQITNAIKDLPSTHRMCLSGTPILGHPNDLWSQLHFLNPQWSGNNYWAFTTRFCEIEKSNWGNKPIGLTPSKKAQDLLTKVLSLVSVGGENHKVTQGKNIIPIKLPMDLQQKTLYRSIVKLALEDLEKRGLTVKNAMDQIIKQQQVTTNCCKFEGCKHNPKFEWVRDWLEDNEGEPLVVFSKFAETAKALQQFLKMGELYIGEMSAKERLSTKEKFIKNVATTRVLIGTIGALGTGVDGLQQVCRNVCFLDRDWTPGINEQAEDRVNRSGQVGMTNVWILHMQSTIDEYVDKVQNKKAEDIEEVFKNVYHST